MNKANLVEQLTSADFRNCTGFINQGWWEWYCFSHVKLEIFNIERSLIADKLQQRNIDISFNKIVMLLLMSWYYTYSDEFVIDVETGFSIIRVTEIQLFL